MDAVFEENPDITNEERTISDNHVSCLDIINPLEISTTARSDDTFPNLKLNPFAIKFMESIASLTEENVGEIEMQNEYVVEDLVEDLNQQSLEEGKTEEEEEEFDENESPDALGIEEEEGETLFHRFPGQDADMEMDRQATASSSGEGRRILADEMIAESDEEINSTSVPKKRSGKSRRNQTKSPEKAEQDLIKERLETLNRQMSMKNERKMSRKESVQAKTRASVAAKELVSIKGLIQNILERPTYTPGTRHRALGEGELENIRSRFTPKGTGSSISAKAVQRERFLKLRTRKTIDNSKKKAPPLPVTPPKPDPFRKKADQALDAHLLMEQLLIIKKEVRYDDSIPDKVKNVLLLAEKSKPCPTRKGPFYEEPFLPGSKNARLYNLMRKIDKLIDRFDDSVPMTREEEENVQTYIHQEFKDLISTGGFYPSISYTPEKIILFEMDDKKEYQQQPSPQTLLQKPKESLPMSASLVKQTKTAPAPSLQETKTTHFPAIPAVKRATECCNVFSQPAHPAPERHVLGFNENHTMTVSPYFLSYFKRSKAIKPATAPSSSLKPQKRVVVVGLEGVRQNKEPCPIQLPSLHSSKSKNPIQSIVTGMENHGKLKRAKFRLAFHRDYKQEMKHLEVEHVHHLLNKRI